MKVLLLSELFPPHGMGAQKAIYLQARALAQEGIDVRVVTHRFPGEKAEEVIDGIMVHRFPIFAGGVIWRARETYINRNAGKVLSRIFKILKAKRYEPDIVHIADLWIEAADFVKRKLKKPVVTSIHSYASICYYVSLAQYHNFSSICDSCRLSRCIAINNMRQFLDKPINAILTPIEILYAQAKMRSYRKALLRNDYLITPTDEARRIIVSFLPELSNRVVTIPPQLPQLPFVEPVDHEPKFNISYFGGESISKGFYNLLKAFTIAAKKNPELFLYMTMCKGSRFAEEWLERYNLHGRVFLLPKLSLDQMKNLLAITDAVIAPSLWPETFCQVVAEANLAGRIVIANPLGGPKELIKDGLNGFFTDCFDVKSLAMKILEVSKLPRATILEMGRKSREYILKKFDNKHNIYALISLYEKAIAQHFPKHIGVH
ncbi:MAG: glycosyltransferase family 4 protein [Candidatus Korarchaeota archaeon]|nr:glycosyltransferase family 4 protein [Thermoproteota archaeon]